MSVRDVLATFRGFRVPHYDIIERKKWWFALSGLFIALSIGGLAFRGLNFSIDFQGGALLSYPDPKGATVEQVRTTLVRFGRTDAEVQIVNGTDISIRTATLNTSTQQAAAQITRLKEALAEQAGIKVEDINTQDIGPTWGGEISRKALTGLIVFLVLVTIFISFRFEWRMALGAQAALLHDLIITAGIYALVGREVTPATVIAILTILGYSLYDTVVIYDKVRENTESVAMVAAEGYTGVVDISLNQTLMRSVNTSLVVLLPILSLLLFGGDTLKDFAFALSIGVTSGAYSSIFVASPILALLKEREPKYQQMRARAMRQQRIRAVPAAVPAATEGLGDGRTAAGGVGSAAAGRSTARAQARPRPKGKRKPSSKRKRR